jgi:peptidoglycan/LPS O-acetylase OafA/YrhL
MTGGATSVQCFYIISGFFIAMILTEKYNQPEDVGLFYSNRFLRIYPVYWTVFALALALNGLAQLFTHHSAFTLWTRNQSQMTAGTTGFLIASNLAVFGQDFGFFLGIGQKGLYWTSVAERLSPTVSSFQMIPPAWSLGLELTFYLMAPWLIRKRTSILVLIWAASLFARYVGQLYGLINDPWSYRFFPFELALFLTGVLIYRLVYKNDQPLIRRLHWAGFLCFPLVLFHPLIASADSRFFVPGQVLFYFAFAASVPLLFHMTNGLKWDRRIGEISFPLYLCHFLVVDTVDHFREKIPSQAIRISLALGVSLALAVVVAVLLDQPLNRFRQQRFRRQKLAGGDLEPEVICADVSSRA